MIRVILGVLVLALLSGCCLFCVKVREFKGPDGGWSYHITCKDNEGRCLDAAGRTCPDGYQVMNTNRRFASAGFLYGVYMESYDYTMIIQCKGAPEPDAPALDCRNSEYCRQLGRCRTINGKCVR